MIVASVWGDGDAYLDCRVLLMLLLMPAHLFGASAGSRPVCARLAQVVRV